MKPSLDTAGSPLARYGTAVVATIAAAALTAATWSLCSIAPMSFFVAAVMLAGWNGGAGPSLLATALSIGAADLLFLPPRLLVAVDRDGAGELVAFAVVSAFIAASAEAKRAAERRTGALREVERAHRRLLDASRECLKTLSLDGRILAINETDRRVIEAAGEFGGLDAIRGVEWAALWPEEQRADIRAAVARAAAGETVRLESSTLGRDDGPRTWETLLVPVPGPDGGPERLHGVSRDITPRKRAEAGLRASEEKYRSLFGSIDEGFCIVELIRDESGRVVDYRFLEVNPAFSAHTGLADATGRTIRELVPDLGDEPWFEIYGRVAESGKPVRFVESVPKLAGRWLDLYAFSLGGPRVAVLLKDITDKLRADQERERLLQEVRNERGRLLSWLDNAPAFITMVSGPDHVFEYANRLHREMLGGRDEVGRKVRDVVPELERQGFTELLDRVYRTGEPFVGQEMPVLLGDPGGGVQKRFVNFVYQATCEPDGAISGVLVIGFDVTDMVNARDALRESEARFRALADSMPQAVWTAAPDGEVDYVNQKWRDYFGPAVGKEACPEITHPDDLPRVIDAWREATRTGRPYQAESRLRGTDGQYRWYLGRALPIKDAEGRIVRWYGSTTDIDDVKRMAEAVRESEARFRALADSMPQNVWTVDANGEFEFLNSRWREYFGFPDGFPSREAAARNVHPDDREGCLAAWRESIATGRPFEFESRLRRADGRYRWHLTRALPVRDAEGRIVRWHGTDTDIDDVKRLSVALRESEARFRALVSASSDVVFRVSPDWAEMRYLQGGDFIADSSEPKSAWIREHVHPDDQPKFLDAIREAMRTRSGFELEHRAPPVGGEPGWTSSRAVPLLNAAGEVVEWLGAATDVTHRKLAEESLKQADRRKDEFLATLAHELRNPLSPIRNGLQILARGPTEEAAATTIEMMERQLAHMVRLIDDLMDVARIGSGKIVLRKERTDLRAAAAAAVEGTRSAVDAGGHELTVHLPDEPLPLDADPTRLTQILANLLTNAAKYTKLGGKIELIVGREGSEAVVNVKDSGVGLAPEMLSRVFDMFIQVDESVKHSQGGLGIGLTIVKRLVELHGGHIEARSEGPGRGCEFIVRFPLARDEGGESRAPDHDEARAKRDAIRILVVDDNRDSANSLSRLLALDGHDVRTAYDGEGALAAALDAPPDAVLLDLGLPDKNGYEVAAEMRAHPELDDAMVIALTGWGQPEDRRRSREAGFDHHLVKPVDVRTLRLILGAVARSVRERQADGAASKEA